MTNEEKIVRLQRLIDDKMKERDHTEMQAHKMTRTISSMIEDLQTLIIESEKENE